jgi:hypothetical protein
VPDYRLPNLIIAGNTVVPLRPIPTTDGTLTCGLREAHGDLHHHHHQQINGGPGTEACTGDRGDERVGCNP